MPLEENLTKILARRAAAAVTLGDWPLVESLARLLTELDTRAIVATAGRSPWVTPATSATSASGVPWDQMISDYQLKLDERVREVPLVKMPMRDDQGRPVDGPAVATPMRTCCSTLKTEPHGKWCTPNRGSKRSDHERVREVPLVKMPMRDDQGRPVDGPATPTPVRRCAEFSPTDHSVRCQSPVGHTGAHTNRTGEEHTMWTTSADPEPADPVGPAGGSIMAGALCGSLYFGSVCSLAPGHTGNHKSAAPYSPYDSRPRSWSV